MAPSINPVDEYQHRARVPQCGNHNHQEHVELCQLRIVPPQQLRYRSQDVVDDRQGHID